MKDKGDGGGYLCNLVSDLGEGTGPNGADSVPSGIGTTSQKELITYSF
jgi:hypothetical protein